MTSKHHSIWPISEIVLHHNFSPRRRVATCQVQGVIREAENDVSNDAARTRHCYSVPGILECVVSLVAAESMKKSIPNETILAFAKTICAEATRYGFDQIDIVRLINEMMDITTDAAFDTESKPSTNNDSLTAFSVDQIPLESPRLRIRLADAQVDKDLLAGWLDDYYGRHFLLSSATAQPIELDRLLTNDSNSVGIVSNLDGNPIGAVAYLDIDPVQKRAELRKLIGEAEARGQGFAEEATRLWIKYGGTVLGLQKIYVSTLQTHIRNIQLNESIGFRVEGLLSREVLIDNVRHDVLRMGLSYDSFIAGG